MQLTMPTVSAGFTARIFTTRFTGTPGTGIRTIMIPTSRHGIILHGPCRGTGDGDIAGIHLTIAGVMAIHLTAGAGPITAGGTPTTAHGIADIIPVTTVATTTTGGMQILTTTGTDIEGPPERMYATETPKHAVHQRLPYAPMALQQKAVATVKL